MACSELQKGLPFEPLLVLGKPVDSYLLARRRHASRFFAKRHNTCYMNS